MSEVTVYHPPQGACGWGPTSRWVLKPSFGTIPTCSSPNIRMLTPRTGCLPTHPSSNLTLEGTHKNAHSLSISLSLPLPLPLPRSLSPSLSLSLPLSVSLSLYHSPFSLSPNLPHEARRGLALTQVKRLLTPMAHLLLLYYLRA